MSKYALFILFCWALLAPAQDLGAIAGKIYDKSSGEELIGSSVLVEGTSMVAFADINGSFRIPNVPTGTYTVIATMDGFSKTTVTEVVVTRGEVTRLEIEMAQSAFEAELVVTAELLEESEAGLLKYRQRANAISDAISAEVITRSGGSTAADAVTKVTGASVVGGKYVYIRGLGDRYTSTHLNGVELPSADPDKNSFQADLFPAQVLENIVTIKSFTPDKPGNFSGGIMDIGTKNFPADFTMGISMSGTYNSEATGNDNYITYSGSDTDWLGMDDGFRAIPQAYDDPGLTTPSLLQASRDGEAAQLLDDLTRSFVPVMSHRRSGPENDFSTSFSMGDQVWVGDNQLGYLATLSYKRANKFRDGFQTARWELNQIPDEAESLNNLSDFVGDEGSEEVDWGGLVTLSYTIANNHQIGANYIFSQSGASRSAYYTGNWPAQFSSDNAFLESRLLKYTERNLNTIQLQGDHFFPGMANLEMDWMVSTSDTNQDEPDTRIFTNTRSERMLNGEMVDIYSITLSTYQNPARYWREMEETSDNVKLNFTLPFGGDSGINGKIKFGGLFQEKDRAFRETRFEYQRNSNIRYDGDPEHFFGPENIGILGFDERTGRYVFGNVLVVAPDSRGGNYTGNQELNAYYAMIEGQLTSSLRVITGARYEVVDMEITNGEVTGTLDNKDWLPALHFVYDLGGSTNFRLSYGRTLARPHFREKAPYSSFDFIADGIYSGNPDLERTLIENLDFRWEWFTGPGEILAASLFYKEFEKPIEKAYSVRADFGESSFINVDEALVYGIELEARRRLSPADSLSQWSVSANTSLIESEVDIPPEELELLLRLDPDASPTRELQGQSPFIVNVGVNYDHFDRGLAASLFYNIFGERLHEVGFNGVPNAFEQPRNMLDFTISQAFKKSFRVKFVAKNLLDEDVEITQSFKGTDFTQAIYKTGTSFSIGLSYKP